MTITSPTINQNEVEKFSRIAEEWWDEGGKFKPLHQLNPIRIKFIKEKIIEHFGLIQSASPLNNLKLLDVGCGGGLLTVPLGRLGANILGIDVTEKNIKIANAYKDQNNLGGNINFLHSSLEALEKDDKRYDVVLAMEVIEHVEDIELFLRSCINLLSPGGLIFLATLNKTIKSYMLAIVGAEYILRWLPVGTHDWNKFLPPEEIISYLTKHKTRIKDVTGITYNPLLQKWSLSRDQSVNYMLYGIKSK